MDLNFYLSSYTRNQLCKLAKETGDPVIKKAYSEKQKQYNHERKARNPNLLKERAARERARYHADPEFRKAVGDRNKKCKGKMRADPVRHADHLEKRRIRDNKRYKDDAEYREKKKQQRNREPTIRFSHYKKDAKRVGRVFELTREQAFALFQQDCFFCGTQSTSEQLMGIDRFDNSQGYLISNVVPACEICNCYIKHANAWEDMQKHVEAIGAYSLRGSLEGVTPYNPVTSETLEQRLRRYPRQASERGYQITLTNQKMEDLFRLNCVYCNATPNPFNGIDRVNNDEGYEPGNTVACCGICNRMKHSMTKKAFLAQVEKIINHKQ